MKKNWELYNIDSWISHCSILVDTTNKKVKKAVEFIMDKQLPTVKVDRISLTGFDQLYFNSLK